MAKKKPKPDVELPSPGRIARVLFLGREEEVQRVARPSRLLSAGKYLFSLGLYGLWRRRNTAVVTNRRLLLGRGVINRRERSIPRSKILDATFTRRGLSSYTEIVVNGSRGRELVRVGPLTPQQARKFAADLQQD